MTFKPDQPIESRRDDLLGRSSFAAAIADAILSYDRQDSLVIGLYGGWGTGKTSVINLCLERIREAPRAYNSRTKPVVIQFSPWNFSGQTDLLQQFFKQLSVTLGASRNASAKKAANKVVGYAQLLSPALTLLPPHGPLAAVLVKTMLWLVRQATSTGSKDLTAVRDELNRLLAKSPRNLIVIDDVDRLSAEEIRQVFQLVKTIADFPNTIYLMAFDKDVVIEALRSVQGTPGDLYLEKIVQVPFEIPGLNQADLEKVLFAGLDDLLKNVPEQDWDRTYWGNVYHSGLRRFFKTLRHVTRYVNTLRVTFPLVGREVNPVDFLALECFRLFAPQLYSGIRDNPDLFMGTLERDSRGAETHAKELKERCDTIIEKWVQDRGEGMRELLHRLFPILKSIYENTGYGPGWLADWRRERRVCSPDFFQTYFRYSIPISEVSQNEIEALLSLGNDSEAFTSALLQFHSQGRITRLFERLEDYTRESIPIEHIEPVVSSLMDIGDEIPIGDEGPLMTDNPMRILRLTHQLVRRLGSQEERFGVLKRAIERTSSVYTPTHEVGVLGQEHGKYGDKEPATPAERRTVNADQLAELERLAVEKIEAAAQDGRLRKAPRLNEVLFTWREWQGADPVRKFVNELLQTDEGVIDFLRTFRSRESSWGMGDRVRSVKWVVHIEHVSQFTDVDGLARRVQAILGSGGSLQLPDGDLLALRTFMESHETKDAPSEA